MRWLRPETSADHSAFTRCLSSVSNRRGKPGWSMNYGPPSGCWCLRGRGRWADRGPRGVQSGEHGQQRDGRGTRALGGASKRPTARCRGRSDHARDSRRVGHSTAVGPSCWAIPVLRPVWIISPRGQFGLSDEYSGGEAFQVLECNPKEFRATRGLVRLCTRVRDFPAIRVTIVTVTAHTAVAFCAVREPWAGGR